MENIIKMKLPQFPLLDLKKRFNVKLLFSFSVQEQKK